MSTERSARRGGHPSAKNEGDPKRELAARAATPRVREDDIAIVGLAARFPGARDVAEFWQNLRAGLCAIREIPPQRWSAAEFYDPKPGTPGKTISKWAGLLDDVDRFDAALFGIAPREAERMDPQQRLLLEVTWEALEVAGYAGKGLARTPTGVFVGISVHDYLRGLLADPSLVDAHTASGNFLSIAANRLSYVFDLQGPSLAVDTGCSSSLVALHLAVESLRRGECRQAIVGTAHLHFTPELYVNFSQAGMLAPDGRVKAFDHRANGYVRGEGVAALVVRPLRDALNSGDAVWAVIRGSAVNQDGRTNGLTAPSVRSQAAVLSDAYLDAATTIDSVGLLEAHGTGTALGDPVEVQALTEAFRSGDRTNPRQQCALGSVKTNIGHLEPASGLAGLIKAVLALRHGELPPTVGFEEPSRHFRLAETPFFIADRLRPWPATQRPRRAGVSSFGFGGTNAHVVLEEAPMLAPETEVASESLSLLILSAHTTTALAELVSRWAAFFDSDTQTPLADACFTAATGRQALRHRLAVAAASRSELFCALAGVGNDHSTHVDSEAIAQGDAQARRRDPVKLRKLASSLLPALSPRALDRLRLWCSDTRVAAEIDRQLEAQHTAETQSTVDDANPADDERSLLNVCGALWVAGVEIDWHVFYSDRQYRRRPLPTYPFERHRYWLGDQRHSASKHEDNEGAVAASRTESEPLASQSQVDEPQRSAGAPMDHAVMRASQARRAQLTHRIASELARVMGVASTEIDEQTNYMELGLDSIMATQVARALDPSGAEGLDALLFFTYPTVAELAQYLAEEHPAVAGSKQSDAASTSDAKPASSRSVEAEVQPTVAVEQPAAVTAGHIAVKNNVRPSDIAVVAMACRMPGASTPEAWWDALRRGRDCVGPLPAARRELHPGPPVAQSEGGFLDDVAGFDPAFFGLSVREARWMDPQQRLVLEIAWEAIERAGYLPEALATAKTGVFVGASHFDYTRLLDRSGEQHDAHYGSGNSLSMLANRVSYTLNLHGPSLTIDTACSSSLVAVHMACESILRGECDFAVAGGVNVTLLPDDTHALAAAGMLSPRGRCRTFDRAADGYVRGEGAGVVLLRPLDAAVAAGDPVLAVVKGSAVNHDGHAKAGLTAPNPRAQSAVITAALHRAGIDAASVSLIETHGTGTVLGDPLELSGLRATFSTSALRPSTCALAAVKSSTGHLEAAAGIAGLMRTVLAIQHAQLPPTLHVEEPNPRLDLEGSTFYINDRLRAWSSRGPRRAGVSSFGAGGANAHVVLEEPPAAVRTESVASRPRQATARLSIAPSQHSGAHLLTLSANSEESLRALATAYRRYLASPGVASIADICFTANTGRVARPVRLAIVARHRDQLSDRLLHLAAGIDRDELAGAYVFSGAIPSDSRAAESLWLTEFAPRLRALSSEALAVLRGLCPGWTADARWVVWLDELTGDATTATEAAIRKLDDDEYTDLLAALATLWSWGVEIDWSRFYTGQLHRRVALPTSPFARQKCWIDGARAPSRAHREADQLRPATPAGAPDQIAASSPSSIASVERAEGDGSRHVLESWLRSLIAELVESTVDQIDVDVPLVESGVDSILATRAAARIREILHVEVPQTVCFDYVTISGLVAGLRQDFHVDPSLNTANHEVPVGERVAKPVSVAPLNSPTAEQRPPARRESTHAIAVIGMGGRFPQAPSLDAFWENLAAGRDAVREVPSTRWPTRRGEAEGRAANQPPRYAALLDDIESFDAPFFRLSPREAATMDPQQRLLLEVAWETLEAAGYAGRLTGSRTGVFVGAMASEYLPRLLKQPGTLDTHVATGNATSVIANRLSYFLNLAGPCLAVDTACSSSLVAVHLAVESIRRGECEYALAGGTQVGLASSHHEIMNRLGALAPRGRCRTFDRTADGYVLGEGVGLVLLKPLDAAIADGDHIQGVLLGTAMNHSGAAAGLTVPRVESQADVIRAALADACVTPQSISYLEAHGTGTALGDPIEVRGLAAAMGVREMSPQSCALGSVKSNIGHLEPAAGIASLLKVVLALRHGQLPPTLHMAEPNQHLQFESTPFYVNDRLSVWRRGEGPRRAGVSAFGFGGTNAHVVVEEAPTPVGEAEQQSSPRANELLLLSAKSEAALVESARRYAEYLPDHPELAAADIAFTAATGRAALPERLAVVSRDVAGWTNSLHQFAVAPQERIRGLWRGRAQVEHPAVAVLFSGQGAQYAGMGRALYESAPAFRAAWDLCAQAAGERLPEPLMHVLEQDDHAEALLRDTRYAQVALFALQYGLWELWRSWGLEVAAVAGHSVGEYAAACAAGVLDWEAGLELVLQRAARMHELPAGFGMTAVLAPVDEVTAALAAQLDALCVAAINSPRNTVVAGPVEALEQLETQLAAEQVAAQRLSVAGAYHSPQMESVAVALADAAARYEHRPASLPWAANLSGQLWPVGQGPTAEYWAQQARQPVQFTHAVRSLAETGNSVFVELGPGSTLAGFARATLKESEASSPSAAEVMTLASLQRGQDDWSSLSAAAGQLFTRGVELDWDAFHTPRNLHRIPLPTYPFQRRRYWVPDATIERSKAANESLQQDATAEVERPSRAAASAARAQSDDAADRPQPDRPKLDDWFHEPTWLSYAATEHRAIPTGTWLVIDDVDGPGQALAAGLRSSGCRVVLGLLGGGQTSRSKDTVHLDPHKPDEYVQLLDSLTETGPPLVGVVHIGALSSPPLASIVRDRHLREGCMARELHSAVWLLRAAAQRALAGALPDLREMWFVTFNAQNTDDDKSKSNSIAAAATGLVRSARLETPRVSLHAIDLAADAESARIAVELQKTMSIADAPPELAVRHNAMWQPALRRGSQSCDGDASIELPEDGVYLITGGRGGLGLELASWLCERGRPKLILTGRSGMRDEPVPSPAATDSSTTGTQLARRWLAIEQLRGGGADVLPMSVDVADRVEMRRLAKRIERQFGRLDGIFHVAGVAADGMLHSLQPEELDRVLRPKIDGLCTLLETTAALRPGFMVLYSSLAAWAGNVGQATYASANAFLDAWSMSRETSDLPRVMSLAWGPWSDVGMAAQQATQEKLRAAGLNSISPTLGRDLVEQALAHPRPCWVVYGQGESRHREVRLADINPAGRQAGSRNAAAVEPTATSATETTNRSNCETTQVATVRSKREQLSWLRSLLIELLSDVLDLPAPEIDPVATFQDLGVDSILAEEAMDRVRQALDLDRLPATLVFQFPTVAALADHLAADCAEQVAQVANADATTSQHTGSKSSDQSGRQIAPSAHVTPNQFRHACQPAVRGQHDIAVVGYACRFAGADDATEYWQMLSSGRSSVAPMSDERLEVAFGYDPTLRDAFGPRRPTGAFLSGIEQFDPDFFRLSGAEAAQMDPRQRIFLEVAYAALEHAGYGGRALAGTKTGVFVGCGANDYLFNVPADQLGEHAATGGTASTVASRLAYYLDTRGPCLAVDTACSSSLVALHMAIESLRACETECAVVGGVHLHLRLGPYFALSQMGALSRSSTCRPFDAQADGFVPGEGAGVLLLKPLPQAIESGDRIYGVVRGSAINNDGRTGGLTAPNPAAQTEVVAAAWRDAEIDPATISYIAAHGTGTRLGDPLECGALEAAFQEQTDRRQFCRIGSVKGNIGHCDAAAGVASLIQVLLSFEHGQLPPSGNLGAPSQHIPFDEGALVPAASPDRWARAEPARRAGVSAFGFSGTNAHVVVEEPPNELQQPTTCSGADAESSPELFVLSAGDTETLQALAGDYTEYLTNTRDARFADICATTRQGRAHLPLRTAIIACDAVGLLEALPQLASPDDESHIPSGDGAHTLFVGSLDREEARHRWARIARRAWSQLPASARSWLTNICSGSFVEDDLASYMQSPNDGQKTPPTDAAENDSSAADRIQSLRLCLANTATRKDYLECAAALYVLGTEIDFAQLEPTGKFRRVALPTSRYRRRRCWLPGRWPSTSTLGQMSSPSTGLRGAGDGTAVDADVCFCVPVWSPAAAAIEQVAEFGTCLVIGSPTTLAQQAVTHVVEQLARTMSLVQVTFGRRYEQHGRSHYQVAPTAVADYARVLADIDQGGNRLLVVYFASGENDESSDNAAHGSVQAGLALCQALLADRTGRAGRLAIVTSGAEGPNITNAEGAALWGLSRALHREEPAFDLRLLDVTASSHPAASKAWATGVVQDLLSRAPEREIVWRDDQRLTPGFRLANDGDYDPAPVPLRAGGVYLITGGRGDIGLAVARRLAQRYRARLILVGRSTTSDTLGDATTKAIAEMKSAGADVLSFAADVANETAMQQIVDEAFERFGLIDGVFHCAGIIGRRRVRELSSAELADALRPKLDGARVLDRVFQDRPPQFTVYFSSVAARDGNIFQSDYSAANAALDSLAAARAHAGGRTLSINWGLWNLGMGAPLAARLDDRDAAALDPDVALDALERALKFRGSQLLVEHVRAPARDVLRFKSVPGPETRHQLQAEDAVVATSRSPVKAALERSLRTLLARVLDTQRERLDRETSFLDFGLDSMLALKFVRELEARLECQLEVTMPFDHPSLAALADHLGDTLTPAEQSRLAQMVDVAVANTNTEPAPTQPSMPGGDKNAGSVGDAGRQNGASPRDGDRRTRSGTGDRGNIVRLTSGRRVLTVRHQES